jgi:hypothetical protein
METIIVLPPDQKSPDKKRLSLYFVLLMSQRHFDGCSVLNTTQSLGELAGLLFRNRGSAPNKIATTASSLKQQALSAPPRKSPSSNCYCISVARFCCCVVIPLSPAGNLVLLGLASATI